MCRILNKNFKNMNFNLSQMPDRNKRPRTAGITMVMDKGLSIHEAKNCLSVS